MGTKQNLTTASTAGDVSPTTSRAGHLTNTNAESERVTEDESCDSLTVPRIQEVIPEGVDCVFIQTRDGPLHLQLSTTNTHTVTRVNAVYLTHCNQLLCLS